MSILTSKVTAKFEKGGKYLPILQEAPCDKNYQELSYLLNVSGLLNII